MYQNAKTISWVSSVILILVVLLSAVSLTGCGENAGGDTPAASSTSTTTSDPDAAGINLLVSSPQLPSAGTSTVTLTALVKGTGNVALSGKKVNFASTSGVISVVSDTTDATGTATATLGTGGDKINRTITVTASVGSLATTNTVSVTGTTISVSGQGSLVSGASTALTILLKDSNGIGIQTDATTGRVSVASSSGNTLSASSVSTNANGQAAVTVTGTVGGADTITVGALGASSTLALNVSTTSFGYTTPSASAEVNIGTSQPVTVRYAIGGVPQSGAPVSFTTTRGSLSSSSETTNGSGEATVNLSSTTAGPATITASVSGGPSAQRSVEFVAITAASMTLQTSPSVIKTNDGSTVTEQSTITAVVRDAAFNFVKNKTIVFNLEDITGGSISPATAVTNSLGEASIVYTSGPASAATDVIISAYVSGTPAVSKSTTLKVGGKAYFITLGTGTVISSIQGDTAYQLPYLALVSDAAGIPVTGAVVTVKITPISYLKGYYYWVGDPVNRWTQQVTLVPSDPCQNEDFKYPGTSFYGNGMLDAGEDTNGDTFLTPGGIAVVKGPTTDGKTTTDATGFGLLYINYAKTFATWTTVKLEATTLVGGTESKAAAVFMLPGLGTDYSKKDASPPGQVSPFGQSSSCTDNL